MNPIVSLRSSLVLAIALVVSAPAVTAQIVFSGSGPAAASIQPSVDAFRSTLGPLNPNVAGSFGIGRREINWDGVPDAFAAPNNLPANFFNVNSPRGVVLSTPGSGFQVSANAGVAPVDFGNIDPSYSGLFQAFSPQRLFTPLGSNITDVTFFVPGTSTAALTTGFGAVFSDVDLANVSSLQFFDPNNNSLGTYFVPATFGDQTFSFLGVAFPSAMVSRVRITSGNQVLAPGNLANDLVVMDDFIFGEPTAPVVRTPDVGSSGGLLALGLGALLFARHRAARYRYNQ
jgi:hypothetical protein